MTCSTKALFHQNNQYRKIGKSFEELDQHFLYLRLPPRAPDSQAHSNFIFLTHGLVCSVKKDNFFWTDFWVDSKSRSHNGYVVREEVLTHTTAYETWMTEVGSWWSPGGYRPCLRGGWVGSESTFEQLQFTAQYFTVNWNQCQVTLI